MSMLINLAGAMILSSLFFCSSLYTDASTKITCQGKVVDDANNPVAGAKVTLYQLIPDKEGMGLKNIATEERITTTDGDFSFSTEKPPDKPYRFAILLARKEGHAISWDNWEMWKDKTTILTMGKPYTLRGIVVDDNNKPVSEAEVRILTLLIRNPRNESEGFRYLSGFDPVDMMVTYTDASGIFMFKNIPAEAKAEFIVKKAGKATISTYKPRQSINSASEYNPGQYTVESKNIRIVLPEEARIEGRVIEKDTGKAVGGVQLMCHTENLNASVGIKPVVSRDDGTFSFDGLEAGTYKIRDVPSREKMAQWVIKPEIVTATAGQTTTGIVIEASKGGILEVAVRDNEKNPVAGANIYVNLKNNDKQRASGLSNSGGIAAIRLEPGEYIFLGAYKEGYSYLREQKTVTIEDGKTSRLDIELQANPKITGIVRDPAGRPVAGATLRITPSGQREINSDKDGKFEINTDFVYWDNFQKHHVVLIARHKEQNLAAVVDIDENTKTLDVNMLPGIIFNGKVVDSNGKPLAGAGVNVSLRLQNFGTPLGNDIIVTDRDGRYRYNAVPDGYKYDVSARADGYGQSNAEIDTDDAINNHIEIKPLTLKEAALSISGIVVDVNDKPMADVEVSVSGQGQQYRNTITNAEGKFIIDKLCEGQVHIYANARRIGRGLMPVYGNVGAKAGDTNVKIVMRPPQETAIFDDTPNKPTGTLEVVITDDANEAVDGAEVSVRRKDNNRWQNSVSDENGIATLKLVPGEYELMKIHKQGYAPLKERKTVTIEEGKITLLEIELKSNPRVTGIVRDPNGQPVARAEIRVFPGGQEKFYSDKEGGYEIFWEPMQGGRRPIEPVLVIRHIKQNLAAIVDIDENTKILDVNMMPGIVFTGAVVDQNDEPVAGAKINVSLSISGYGMYIDTGDVTTDQNGQYEIKTIPSGRQYTVSTRVEGYYPGYVLVDADSATNNRLEIPLLKMKTANMSIAGIVVDVNERPVPNARVFAIADGQQSPDSTTDEQGRFTISNLCEGEVYIYANAKDGQTELYGRTIVSAGDTDITVLVESPNAAKPLNKINTMEFEQTRKMLATLLQCPNKKELEDAIDKAKAIVDRFEGGHVIVGRVVLDGPGDPREVTAQMEILDDGFFAGETKDLIRPVGFRMHRYAPYDLKLKGMKGSLVDVGTIHLTALKEEQLASLKGRVVLEDNGDASQAVISLSVRNGPINTPHNGTSGRRYWPQPVKVHTAENGLFEATGFSPFSYLCVVKASGYLEKEFQVDFIAGQTLDLGTIILEKPRQIQLTYIVSEEPPFDLNNLQTVSIPAGTRWKAQDDEECYGWDLVFAQEKGSIIMKYFYGPCYLKDLGEGEIADYINVDRSKIGENQPQNQKAKNGHIYLLNQEHWKRWVLFKIVTN